MSPFTSVICSNCASHSHLTAHCNMSLRREAPLENASNHTTMESGSFVGLVSNPLTTFNLGDVSTSHDMRNHSESHYEYDENGMEASRNITGSPYEHNGNGMEISRTPTRATAGNLATPASELIEALEGSVVASDPPEYTKVFGYNPMPALPMFKDYPMPVFLGESLKSWARGVEDWARVFQGYMAQIDELLPHVASDFNYSNQTGFRITISVPNTPEDRKFLDEALSKASQTILGLLSSTQSATITSREFLDRNGASGPPFYSVSSRGIQQPPAITPTPYGNEAENNEAEEDAPTPVARGKGRGLGKKREAPSSPVKAARVMKPTITRKRGPNKKKVEGAPAKKPSLENPLGLEQTVDTSTPEQPRKRGRRKKITTEHIEEGKTNGAEDINDGAEGYVQTGDISATAVTVSSSTERDGDFEVIPEGFSNSSGLGISGMKMGYGSVTRPSSYQNEPQYLRGYSKPYFSAPDLDHNYSRNSEFQPQISPRTMVGLVNSNEAFSQDRAFHERLQNPGMRMGPNSLSNPMGNDIVSLANAGRFMNRPMEEDPNKAM